MHLNVLLKMRKMLLATILCSLPFSTADEGEQSALDIAKSLIEKDVVGLHNTRNQSEEESARTAVANSRFTLNQMMLEKSPFDEELVLRYALAIQPNLLTEEDKTNNMITKVGGRLAELEEFKKLKQVELPEVVIDVKFLNGKWSVIYPASQEKALVYPANHRIVLRGFSDKGNHVLKNNKRGLLFDVIEGVETKCWFNVGDVVEDGHWTCDVDSASEGEKIVFQESLIATNVWMLLFGREAKMEPKK